MEEGKVTTERVGGAIGGGAENEVYDEDEDLLVATAKNPKRNTFFLASLVLLGIGFLGGMEYQKHEGTSSVSAGGTTGSGSSARFASALGGGGSPRSGAGASSFRSLFSGGGAGGSGGLGGFVAGTVANISGDTLYVTEASGNTVAVSTTGSAFSKTVAGSVNDVLPGDTVTVRASKQPDGSYEATSVSISSAGAAPGGVGGGFGGTSSGGAGSFGPFG